MQKSKSRKFTAIGSHNESDDKDNNIDDDNYTDDNDNDIVRLFCSFLTYILIFISCSIISPTSRNVDISMY